MALRRETDSMETTLKRRSSNRVLHRWWLLGFYQQCDTLWDLILIAIFIIVCYSIVYFILIYQ